jgi:hypothetical protein
LSPSFWAITELVKLVIAKTTNAGRSILIDRNMSHSPNFLVRRIETVSERDCISPSNSLRVNPALLGIEPGFLALTLSAESNCSAALFRLQNLSYDIP